MLVPLDLEVVEARQIPRAAVPDMPDRIIAALVAAITSVSGEMDSVSAVERIHLRVTRHRENIRP